MDDAGEFIPAADVVATVAEQPKAKAARKSKVVGVRAAKPMAAKAAPEKPAAAKLKKPAAAPWTFPKNTLEDAIKIARAVEEKNAGNPMKPDMLAKAVGYNAVADWRFLDLLRSAKQYGLVTESGKISPVALTETGQDIIAPSTPLARRRALQVAFRTVDDFKKVEEFYQGKKLPEDEFFENTLLREFSIPRERIRAFIDTFTSI